jgi:hypothetical protein
MPLMPIPAWPPGSHFSVLRDAGFRRINRPAMDAASCDANDLGGIDNAPLEHVAVLIGLAS